jgi:hypothetical protein|tara:strand:- start:112 stop:318 length:207 start_codon:yes stop_codon:yes gene_type:complete
MASKSAPPLPLPLPDYELINEQITRRTIEQLFQDVFSEINGVESLKTSAASKAVKRHQFLLMGAKGNV